MAKNKNPPTIVPERQGKRSIKDQIIIDKALRELYDKSGYNPHHASKIVGCGYEYAIKKFQEWGRLIVEKEDQDWLERNEQARKRALLGITSQVIESDQKIIMWEDQMKLHKFHQDLTVNEYVEKLKKSPLGKAISGLKRDDFFEVLSVMTKYVGTQQSYSYLLINAGAQLRAERSLKAKLNEEYDSIEMMPPAKQVVDAIIEKQIAEKNKLIPMTPKPEKGV